MRPDLRQKPGASQAKTGAKIPVKKCVIMALLTHLLEKATENKRRQATARRRRQAPHIEQARID
jgi:hypothetical protein